MLADGCVGLGAPLLITTTALVSRIFFLYSKMKQSPGGHLCLEQEYSASCCFLFLSAYVSNKRNIMLSDRSADLQLSYIFNL